MGNGARIRPIFPRLSCTRFSRRCQLSALTIQSVPVFGILLNCPASRLMVALNHVHADDRAERVVSPDEGIDDNDQERVNTE
jgi:hypothetical protein